MAGLLLWSWASAAITWNAAYLISTRSGSFGKPWYVALLTDLSLLLLSAVGLVVAVRRPQNAFGWVVLVVVLGFAVQEAATHTQASPCATPARSRRPARSPGKRHPLRRLWRQFLRPSKPTHGPLDASHRNKRMGQPLRILGGGGHAVRARSRRALLSQMSYRWR